MPLPLILGIAAGVAGLGGLGSGTYGAVKMKKANDTMKSADERHKINMKRLEEKNKLASKTMDELGEKELAVLKGFEKFSNLIEKIQNRPQFDKNDYSDYNLPECDIQQMKKVSVGAGVLMGGLGGAALGTAGGFAAAGATTAAVMALGTASTGTAIASLGGAAATNATLAAIGGGAIAAGGGGIALGTTILGATTLGVGLLVGGAIFGITGSSLSKKADDAWEQMLKAESKIDNICMYLKDLTLVSSDYYKLLCSVDSIYVKYLNKLRKIVVEDKKTDWNEFSSNEKTITQNTVILVQVLFKMCQVKLVISSGKNNDINSVNKKDINDASKLAYSIIRNNDFNAELEKEQDYSDDENYCIAVSALMYCFALCDGSIAQEEKNIIDISIDALMFSNDLSKEALNEIYTIQNKDRIEFDEIVYLLDKVPKVKLENYSSKLEEIIESSDGISDVEKYTKAKFDLYLAKREQ